MRAVLLVRRALKPVKKALAEAIKPEFQSLPKTAHSTSREFGKRRPNYKGKGRPFGIGKTLGDVSVPLTAQLGLWIGDRSVIELKEQVE